MSDVSARILARKTVSVSASWNAGLTPLRREQKAICELLRIRVCKLAIRSPHASGECERGEETTAARC